MNYSALIWKHSIGEKSGDRYTRTLASSRHRYHHSLAIQGTLDALRLPSIAKEANAAVCNVRVDRSCDLHGNLHMAASRSENSSACPERHASSHFEVCCAHLELLHRDWLCKGPGIVRIASFGVDVDMEAPRRVYLTNHRGDMVQKAPLAQVLPL